MLLLIRVTSRYAKPASSNTRRFSSRKPDDRKLAKQHGHSVQTMLQIYAAWIEGAEDEDIETIKRAMHATKRNHPATEAEAQRRTVSY
jgi:hypothetical protein